MQKYFTKLGKLSDQLYREQILGSVPVYPEHFSLEKIRRLKKLGSSYDCLVESGGKQYEVGFNHAYRDTLLQVELIFARLLESRSGSFSKPYVKAVMEAIRNNSWAEADEVWLAEHLKKDFEYVLFFGPAESYSDTVWATKKFFAFTALKIDHDLEKLYRSWIVELKHFYASIPELRQLPVAKVRLLAGDLVCHGGELKKLGSVGWSRPDTDRLLNLHGSVKQLFVNKIFEKVEQLYLPATKLLFQKEQASELTKYFKEQYVSAVALHELCHTVGKFLGYKERMGAHYNSFEELRAESLAHILAKYLEQKQKLPKGFGFRMALGELVVGSHMALVYRKLGIRKAYADMQRAFARILGEVVSYDGKKIELIKPEQIESLLVDLGKEMLAWAKKGQADKYLKLTKSNLLAEQLEVKLGNFGLPTTPTNSSLKHNLRKVRLNVVNNISQVNSSKLLGNR